MRTRAGCAHDDDAEQNGCLKTLLKQNLGGLIWGRNNCCKQTALPPSHEVRSFFRLSPRRLAESSWEMMSLRPTLRYSRLSMIFTARSDWYHALLFVYHHLFSIYCEARPI